MLQVNRLNPQQMQDSLRAILPFMHLLFELGSWIGWLRMMADFSKVTFEQIGWYTWNPACIEGYVSQNAKLCGCYDSTRHLSGYLLAILLASVPAQGKRGSRNFGTVNQSFKRDSNQDLPHMKHECTLQMFIYRNRLAMHKVALLILRCKDRAFWSETV
jgi:hypothetical protein